ncbi:tRNA (adenosine(37)-N6)-threonylcarbamoyltransferase complex transferase subunit TsaD [Verrucomicrobiaceae bacterium R5-34]|uniref:tRNA N6-adenosine threonylcarbamoyltransferase n=1 Tax=Oceaniferula flava TaxID=2800421 RepID=A0AAE2VDD3_9BACT|nr:tRNA (adenosine(37)-N6)-threonylcarbamoyltransferase complex transferase subunit TsaD [Oceaniferula flavus]MBK1830382.1 tRNA (adenosine(37)-N6)-threonylcarbamoyltransferase complex transferase subunit TsaD [Verrucomicrobiaceae bacterium R5-34]MBK1854474.1 tRNA (adenosine(37)-N6)-threonylcarbamoyltransferase complex transferase subunit TsaD [Oceaniferula flavus]MBM1135780.1 tRNA (adenosine(37)-N6)-threonylcarbamoyltransferase complex transferase subunit TsaD [Oceaniferula flavus]
MPTTILAIESSCDETAVAILRHEPGQLEILASEISSQIDIHREFGGVVPELASRNHSLHLRPLIELALANAGLKIHDIDAFGATAGPGLASSLLVGNTTAKSLSVATGKPFISVNHMEGHLLSPFLEAPELKSNLALIVSGGHTLLIHMRDFGDYKLLGSTRDDAAGEAYDKVGKMLGLPYPGGPEIEKQAHQGSATAFDFPRAMMKEGLDFSFSGLKTAVLYQLEKLDPEQGRAPKDAIPDLCASFQQAVIDVLVTKTLRAAAQCGEKLITLSGGVSCNKTLRNAMQEACDQNGLELLIAPPALSTDNAAMIGFVALHSHLRGKKSSLHEDINPNLKLAHA